MLRVRLTKTKSLSTRIGTASTPQAPVEITGTVVRYLRDLDDGRVEYAPIATRDAADAFEYGGLLALVLDERDEQGQERVMVGAKIELVLLREVSVDVYVPIRLETGSAIYTIEVLPSQRSDASPVAILQPEGP